MGIYVVEIIEGERTERAVVVAESASSASRPYGRDTETRTVIVGRLGTYDPGIGGIMLHNASGDEIVYGRNRANG